MTTLLKKTKQHEESTANYGRLLGAPRKQSSLEIAAIGDQLGTDLP
jgi:hypothetical protein